MPADRPRLIVHVDLTQRPAVIDFRRYPCPGCGATDAWEPVDLPPDLALGRCRCGGSEIVVAFAASHPERAS